MCAAGATMADVPSDVLESDPALEPGQPPDSGSRNTNRRRFYSRIWFWIAVIAVIVMAGAIAIAAIAKTDARVAHHVVIYRVTSDAGTARAIDYLSINGDGTGAHEQLRDVALPWSAVIDRKGNWPLFLMDASGADGSTTISCSITVDGKVVAQKTSTSASAVIACDAPADIPTH